MNPHVLPLESVECPKCGKIDAQPLSSGSDYEYGTTSQQFQFLQCAACSVAYLSPRPTSNTSRLIYPPNYYSFAGDDEGHGLVGKLRELWEQRKVRDYTRFLGPGPRRILDVGCGRGRLLSVLQGFNNPYWELYGIDLDADAVAIARGRGFRATQASVEDYSISERFDLIVLQQIIEHVADPRRVIAKLRELLVPGGVLVLETPNLAGWDYKLFRNGLWGGYHFPRHWTLFTRSTLRELVEEVGLKVIEQRSLLSLAFWTWSIHHWFLVRQWPGWFVRWLRPPNVVLLSLSFPLEVLQLCLAMETSNQRLVACRT
jgi:SAM-dependent methyltransferase